MTKCMSIDNIILYHEIHYEKSRVGSMKGKLEKATVGYSTFEPFRRNFSSSINPEIERSLQVTESLLPSYSSYILGKIFSQQKFLFT